MTCKIIVVPIARKVGAEGCTVLKLVVGGVDTAVDDVGDGASAGRVIEGVDIVGVLLLLAMRDAAQTPGGVCLGDEI